MVEPGSRERELRTAVSKVGWRTSEGLLDARQRVGLRDPHSLGRLWPLRGSSSSRRLRH